ncbi:hypothetical protein Tco_0879622, partial [Tanacetum coccineum]
FQRSITYQHETFRMLKTSRRDWAAMVLDIDKKIKSRPKQTKPSSRLERA